MLTRPSVFFFRHAQVALLIFVLVAAPCSPALAAMPASAPAASAASIIGKDAELNGAHLAAGATLFPGDVIRLGEASTAALEFGNNLVLAAPETELVVESDGVGLRNGRLQVRANGGESFAVSAPFFQVNIAASGGIPSSAEIRLDGTLAQVSAVAGAADLMAAGEVVPYRLRAGDSVALNASPANASPIEASANPAAGQVARIVPQVQIDRAMQHFLAGVSDRVYWNDGLRSGPTGRAHIMLNGGSELNLGSDSSLRILRHDAEAQQTSLELLMGRLRGKTAKLSRAGAKFEVHTPLGVAGPMGADFSLLVANDSVELMAFDGSVRFTNMNGQSASVSAGNRLLISKTGAFEGPSPATLDETRTAKDQTDASSTSSQGSQAPASAAKRPLAPLVITLTGSAAAVGIGVWQATRPTVSVSVP